MPGAYHQLLDATIGHLELLKQRGVRYVDVSPELLSCLVKPTTQKTVAAPLGQAVPAVIPQRADEPDVYDSPKLSAAEKESAMAKLRDEALACVRCGHLVSSRTQVVFGVGTVQADLVFVGEAPGQDEDKEGEPFVGAAGQLLTKIIQATGLDRDKVYIANILKCRPDTPGKV